MNKHQAKEIMLGTLKAQLFDKEGIEVNVKKDDGSILKTKTRSLPWQLGHGSWVISVDGISGGYDLTRVTKA